jgi:hypothetical protein
MKKLYLILSAVAILVLAAFAWLKGLEAKSSEALLEAIRRIRPQATVAGLTEMFGPAMYTIEAPNFPPWLESSAIGGIKRGTVLVFYI